jgi:hypothetical protein
MRRALALAALLLAGCPKPTTGAKATPVGDPFSGESSDETAVLRHELESEVRESYERDEVSTTEDWQDVLDPSLGIVRFGVRPGDEQVVTKGATPPRRLPLRIVASDDGAGACEETLRSNDLRVYLSPDASTAWVTDELTACVPACGKQALLPLRLSAVYVRGGDRWVLAVEHLSYPQPAASLIARGDDHATAIDSFVSRRASAPDLANLVPSAIAETVPADRESTFATDGQALAWWPDPAHELRGAAISGGPSLTDAFDAASITTEGARLGIGPQTGPGAIAWWAGMILVKARTGLGGENNEVPLRLRGTFVMRRDPDRWRIVQSHVSAPIDDQTLAHEIAADAKIVDGRIIVPCDRATPAAARR